MFARALALTLALFGCRSEAARRLEAEALALERPIDSLRNAPDEAKPALLEALSKARCESKPACELKATCVDGYTLYLASREASRSARALLEKPDGGTRAAIEAAQALTRAELDLRRSKELTERCASLQGLLLRSARKR